MKQLAILSLVLYVLQTAIILNFMYAMSPKHASAYILVLVMSGVVNTIIDTFYKKPLK